MNQKKSHWMLDAVAQAVKPPGLAATTLRRAPARVALTPAERVLVAAALRGALRGPDAQPGASGARSLKLRQQWKTSVLVDGLRVGGDPLAAHRAACRRALARRLVSAFGSGPGRAVHGSPATTSRDRTGEFDPGSERTLAAGLTHASRTRLRPSGERVSNTWVTCPLEGDNPGKPGLIPRMAYGSETSVARGWARVPLFNPCWWGNGPPRVRWVAGLRGRSATLGLRHGPDSYGRQQWGILRNGRKPDAATPRE